MRPVQDRSQPEQTRAELGGRTPSAAHAERKRRLEEQAQHLDRVSRLISTSRLITLAGAVVLGFLRGFGYLPEWVLGVAVVLAAGFVVLVVWHIRLDRAERRVAAAIAFHHWAIERIAGRFEGYPARGDRFVSDAHPYSSDLGIYGESSLFQLVDATHTRSGEDCLGKWLGEPSDADAVLARQGAARDLASRESLREELFVLGTLIAKDRSDPGPLLKWAEGEPVLSSVPFVRVLGFVLPLATVAALGLSQVGVLSAKIGLALLAGQWLYGLSLSAKIEPVAAALDARAGAFAQYRAMLKLVEAEPFEAARLREVQGQLTPARPGERKASRELQSLSSIAGFLDARRNEVFRLFIGPVVLWDVHCILALEAWQKRAGKNARQWLDVIGEVEALASLGGFAHDHPEYRWPTIASEPTFRARGIGHPLIDPNVRVCNDLELRGPGTALLVTGSNMSGKSTLLRSMGINSVLAMAGAPVVADELVLSSFEVRTSMWARDSLAKGVSHFYAELEKLKRVVDGLGGPRPLLFLLDEILQGTNSRERVIGARSVLRHLLEKGAMGAVSTHDVGLLELGPNLDPRVDKVHFEEQVTGDDGVSKMTFDYRLRPGVVRSTNALRLMKMVGIDVDLE
jgi:MutS domain V